MMRQNKQQATCVFLASVVVTVVTPPVLEPVLRVTDASSPLVGFTTRPVSVRRRVAVVPSSIRSCVPVIFVQSEPVICGIQ